MAMTNDVQALPKLAYSVEEAGEVIGISRRTIYELMSSGALTSVKIGSRRLVRHDDLADFLRRLDSAE
jgi:excisionase family DNA binding protein